MTYIITDSGYFKIQLFVKNEPEIRKVKILADITKTKSAFAIFGNKLAVLGVSGIPFGSVIESPEVADLVKMMFMLIWQNLPEKS